MAYEVNLDEMDVAARVRSVLVSRISAERRSLWLPEDTRWSYRTGVLTIGFTSEFACQLCRKMLGAEITAALRGQLDGRTGEVRYEVLARSVTEPGSDSDARIDQRSVARVSGRMAGSGWNGSEPPGSGTADLAGPRRAVEASPRSLDSSPAERHPRAVVTQVALQAQGRAAGEPPARPGPVATSAGHASATGASPTVDLWSRIIAGDSNQLACTAMNMVVSDPGRMSPVVLHGPTGIGKSLMLSALAQRLRSGQRMRRVLYMTSEQFTNDFTEALRSGGLPLFRRKYRDVEALMLDDLQFLVGKRSTMAEVRHTIDNLLRAGRQIVVSVDRPLSELSGLGEELLGRLRGGLVAPVSPLDVHIRAKLLQQLSQEAGISIDPPALACLAERLAGDGRLIRGVIHRLTAVASVHPGKLRWDRCWAAVHDLVQAAQPVVRLADIERAVCGVFGLQQDCLQSKTKMRAISQPRMLAMFLARKYTPAAYQEIGQYFGHRRHSTVISAEKTVEQWLSNNAPLESSRQMTVREVIRHVEAQLQVG